MYTTNEQHRRDVYTLQSMKTGKYISRLFEEDHSKSFQGDADNCYTWSTLEHIQRVQKEIACSLIVKV